MLVKKHRSIGTRLLVAASIGITACTAVAVQTARAKPALAEQSLPRVVEELAVSLERYFLDPAVGRLYAGEIRHRLASGRYRGLAPTALAQTVTSDLQKVHRDGHLRLRAPSDQPMLGAPSAAGAEKESAETGIDKSGWLADGVAYIGFELFPSSKASLAAVREFLEKHASARVLIIDVRTHGGGYTDEFDLLASYIYDQPAELIYEDTREAAFRPKPDTATLKRIAGPPGFVRQAHLAAPTPVQTSLRNARVLVLTSGYTGSAAEHLTLALKRTGRATVIGETTAGMGHFGRIVELPGGFSAFIPIGRPFDPATGLGWEGIGIKPHQEVPARRALEVALLKLGFSPEQASVLGQKWMPRGEMDRVTPLRIKPASQ
jgi:hypothetical protein